MKNVTIYTTMTCPYCYRAKSLLKKLGVPYKEISVDYSTSDGTAIAGSDYTATSGTLIIAPGQTSGTISVPILADLSDENNETANINLSNARISAILFWIILGTFDDFILTSLSLQNNGQNFVDKKQAERKKILSQFMGIDLFDKLYDIAKRDVSDERAYLKKIKDKDVFGQLSQLQKELQNYVNVKEALLQDLLSEYKKTALVEGQIAQVREQSCKELKVLHTTREAGLHTTFATQLRNKLNILAQLEQKGQETVQRQWQHEKKLRKGRWWREWKIPQDQRIRKATS